MPDLKKQTMCVLCNLEMMHHRRSHAVAFLTSFSSLPKPSLESARGLVAVLKARGMDEWMNG